MGILLLLAALTGVLVLFIFLFIRFLSSKGYSSDDILSEVEKTIQDKAKKPLKRRSFSSKKPSKRERAHVCYLCREYLEPGKPMKTAVYPEQEGKGRMIEIMGCPNCYPPNRYHKRDCPLCKSRMQDKDLAIGRMYDQGDHYRVEIKGCTSCYNPKGPSTKVIAFEQPKKGN